MQSKSELRRQLRHRRRSLSRTERNRRARALALQFIDTQLAHRCQRVAVFLPNDGEPDLKPLIRRLWAMGKQCYLPVLNRHRLWFLPYYQHTPLRPNRFQIPEPAMVPNRRIPPQTLDLVLTPLVAFDRRGNRLGMGGGFYDRTFAYLDHRRHWRRPQLLGVAFDFQEVEELPAHPWDVPLNGVITDSRMNCLG